MKELFQDELDKQAYKYIHVLYYWQVNPTQQDTCRFGYIPWHETSFSPNSSNLTQPHFCDASYHLYIPSKDSFMLFISPNGHSYWILAILLQLSILFYIVCIYHIAIYLCRMLALCVLCVRSASVTLYRPAFVACFSLLMLCILHNVTQTPNLILNSSWWHGTTHLPNMFIILHFYLLFNFKNTSKSKQGKVVKYEGNNIYTKVVTNHSNGVR